MMSELKAGHVLAILLSFFGVTVAVNIAFATYAISTFSGEDVSKPYLRGLQYNRTIAERKAQNALNWSAEIGAVRGPAADITASVRVVGADGRGINGLKVEANLRRPTDANLDRAIMLRPTGDGAYGATARNIAPGQWDVIARATSADGAIFEARRRVMVP
jgi:nitrogen fixation protein FixH